mmetsp:Transcript_126865/g.247224  ORF Transcript_126865/g.247224 Transcript_126865/m.247224 type:complete len:372 (+) Transcript_126865:134-1249(+)
MGASTCSVAGLCGRDAVPGPTVPGPVPEAAPGRFGNREGNDYDVAGGMSGHSCGSSFRNGSPHSGHDHVQMHPRPNTAEASLAANYLHREDGELCTLIPGGNGQLGKRTRRRWQFGTGAVYDGQWLGNARDGMGKMSWPDGAEYFGEWVRNTATGQGMFCHLDGDAYVGQWRSNLAHGYGIFTAKDGLSYIGEFFDDLQEGFGVLSCPDGSRFCGKFSQSRRIVGCYEWPDTSFYEGEWQDNRIHGAGMYSSADDRRYEGQWHTSTMHGCGKYSWSDGRCYAGQYRLDQKDGFGIYTWADGRRYEGYWLSGKQHHIGRLYTGSSTSRLARFERGTRVDWLGDEEEAPVRDEQGQRLLRSSAMHSPPVPRLR